jgi:hypothetical protein
LEVHDRSVHTCSRRRFSVIAATSDRRSYIRFFVASVAGSVVPFTILRQIDIAAGVFAAEGKGFGAFCDDQYL